MLTNEAGTRVFHILSGQDGKLVSHCGHDSEELRKGGLPFHDYIITHVPGFRETQLVCADCWEHAVLI